MRQPKRVSMSLLDSELQELLSSNLNVIPITQDNIDNNTNPGGLLYGRLGRAIYIWFEEQWQYVVADDIDIEWKDIKSKPTSFIPSEHTHNELHNHTNKNVLDSITGEQVTTWNTTKDKANIDYVNTELSKKSDSTHNHNNLYAVKSLEEDVSNVESFVGNLEGRLFNIEQGYTEGHMHPNTDELNSITQEMINSWNTVSSKATIESVSTGLSGKADKSTVDGHINNSTVHVTQSDKNRWNKSPDASSVKPTDGSLWYKVIR